MTATCDGSTKKMAYDFELWGIFIRFWLRFQIYSQEVQKFRKQLFSNKKCTIYRSIKIISQTLPLSKSMFQTFTEKSTEKRTDLPWSLFSNNLSLFLFGTIIKSISTKVNYLNWFDEKKLASLSFFQTKLHTLSSKTHLEGKKVLLVGTTREL